MTMPSYPDSAEVVRAFMATDDYHATPLSDVATALATDLGAAS